jgi:hypothetical protein
MISVFDYLTVACFAGLVIAFLQFTDRNTRTLMHLMISAVALAIANQVGNAGRPLLALGFLVAGAGYAWIVVQGRL